MPSGVLQGPGGLDFGLGGAVRGGLYLSVDHPKQVEGRLFRKLGARGRRRWTWIVAHRFPRASWAIWIDWGGWAAPPAPPNAPHRWIGVGRGHWPRSTTAVWPGPVHPAVFFWCIAGSCCDHRDENPICLSLRAICTGLRGTRGGSGGVARYYDQLIDRIDAYCQPA